MSFIEILLRYPVTFCMTSSPGWRGHHHILAGIKSEQLAGLGLSSHTKNWTSCHVASAVQMAVCGSTLPFKTQW